MSYQFKPQPHAIKKPKHIFKIQRSIATSESSGEQVLIYDKYRQYEGQFPITPELTKLMGNNLKIYVEGKVQADGQLRIIRKTKDKEW